ncbi:LysE family translocator [Planosporangium thailandense]|uniref:LysE family translocator n=1 Tax=Planosporangium thailandense TaxID=765197 RepID=A0ABX0Y8H9_9ACTN|nr:LysE family translocator [Planosporangium thailandense]NJC73569.1 LysE family translocator [Planosporangium thailandense]
MLASILSFTVVAALLTVTPGVDTMLVLSQGLRGGRRTAVACGLGINTGLVCWAAASVLGLSALLAASHAAYEIVRLLGAAYLVYVGARGLLMTWRRRGGADGGAPVPGTETRRTALAAYRRGITTNLLNPKVGVFYISLLPQFAPAGHRSAAVMMLLAGIHLTLSIVWLTAMAWLASRVLRTLSTKVTTRLERISGAVMIGLGVRIAAQGS